MILKGKYTLFFMLFLVDICVIGSVTAASSRISLDINSLTELTYTETLSLTVEEYASIGTPTQENIRRYLCEKARTEYSVTTCVLTLSEYGGTYTITFSITLTAITDMVFIDSEPGKLRFYFKTEPLIEKYGLITGYSVVDVSGEIFGKSMVCTMTLECSYSFESPSYTHTLTLTPTVSKGDYLLVKFTGIDNRIMDNFEKIITSETGKKAFAVYCFIYVTDATGRYIWRQPVPDCKAAIIPINSIDIGSYTIKSFAIYSDGSDILFSAGKSTFSVSNGSPGSISIETKLYKISCNYPNEMTTVIKIWSSESMGCGVKIKYLYNNTDMLIQETDNCNSGILISLDFKNFWPGCYLIAAKTDTNKKAYRVFCVERLPVYEAPPFKTDKDYYLPGEYVQIEMPGATTVRCRAHLEDSVATVVSSVTEPQQCSSFNIYIPDFVKPEFYTLYVDIYDGERYLTTKSREIEIREKPPEKNIDRLCDNGFFSLEKDISVMCISPGERCEPSISPGEVMPYCLCFGDAEFPDVCMLNASCLDYGCNNLDAIYSYIKIEGGICKVMSPFYIYSCVTIGEICSYSTCDCVDDAYNIISVCGFGELCSDSGCVESELSARIISITPEGYRKNEFLSGADIEVIAKIYYKNRAYTSETVKPEAALYFQDKVFPLKLVEHRGAGYWGFNFTVEGRFLPGKYIAFMRIKLMDQILNIYGNLYVYVPESEKQLTVEIFENNIEFLRSELDIPKAVLFNIDVKGSDGDYITDLPVTAFKLTFSNLTLSATSAQYKREQDMYKWGISFVIPEFRKFHTEFDGAEPTTDYDDYYYTTAFLNVSYLGMYGESEPIFVKIYREDRPVIEILSIEPRSFIYQIESVLGKTISLNLRFRHLKTEQLDDLRVSIKNAVYRRVFDSSGSELVSEYANETKVFSYDELIFITVSQGVKIIIPMIRFCSPPIFLEKKLELSVYIEGIPDAKDTAYLYIMRNPGDYIYPSGIASVGCDPVEDSYGIRIDDSVIIDATHAEVTVSSGSGFPANSYIVLEILPSGGFISEKYAMQLSGSGLRKTINFNLSPGLPPGSYSYAIYVSDNMEETIYAKKAGEILI